MSNPFKKRHINFMTEGELKEFEKKIISREKEGVLRARQSIAEENFSSKGKGIGFDKEKAKNILIIIVVGIISAIVLVKIVSKFI